MRKLIIILICLAASGCGSENNTAPTVNEPVTKGEYDIKITSQSFGVTKLLGENVDTSWHADDGYIFLNTDDNNKPLGTLTMTIGPTYTTYPDGDLAVAVFTATLSKTDVRVGTADELNAKLYRVTDPDFSVARQVEIGPNFIRGELKLLMERVLVHPTDTPDSALVTGSFTAMLN